MKIDIYRLEYVSVWALEVVDQHGTSTVWDDLFDSDHAALDEALRVIEKEGPATFHDQGNVVQFPRR